jgi:hypothetical protein
MKTFSDLKRDLQIGKTLIMTFNSLANASETIAKRINKPRLITRTQTNGIYLATEIEGKSSFLELPCASLTEYDGKTITIYKCGKRPMTEAEQAILANEPSNRKENEALAERDALTDGSQTYYMDKAYYKANDALWRWDWSKGLRLDINDKTMWDKKIKGEIDLQYTLL